MDGVWDAINYISFVYFRGVMTTVLKAYLLIIGLFSMVMGLWAMTAPDFVSWYPAFENVERKTPLANFIRTMSGVFVASGYILIRFIFSSSKVQLGTVLIYLCAFMLIGKICGLIYEDINKHDIIAFILGLFVLIGLVVVHKQRKNLLNYDL